MASRTAQLPQSTTVSVHSKSHVLAGVQDAYWSDDENEDTECPLCMEQMDVSDLGFKPCPCGYQICGFCWHHIKQNLNGRCPACRREYTDEAVEYTKIPAEEVKRLNQQKKAKERERKDIESLGRKHLLNVRIVQRNQVYVVGLGPRLAKEEFLPALRSNEYFGQYGKISKTLLVKRNQAGSRVPVVGLYVTYHRREDAARAIQAVDGTPSPGGGNEIMRASHGTTKYCMSFLRNVSCSQPGCLDLHDWGDERDCFTKEDLSTLKHTMKDTELGKGGKRDDGSALPRTAAWAQKGSTSAPATGLPPALPRQRQGRESQRTRNNAQSSSTRGNAEMATIGGRGSRTSQAQSRVSLPATTRAIPNSQASVESTSRPSTPALSAVVPPTMDSVVHAAPVSPPVPVLSPVSSAAQESQSETGSSVPEAPLAQAQPPRVDAPEDFAVSQARGQYQLSTQAQALIDDVRARRENSHTSATIAIHSPFPDFDRMLSTLGEDSVGFSLDKKLAGRMAPDIDLENELSLGSNYDPFSVQPKATLFTPPGLSLGLSGPPGLQVAHDPMAQLMSTLDAAPVKASYTGSFNPFSSDMLESPKRSSTDDGYRASSRFAFARRPNSSVNSSPYIGSILSEGPSDGRRIGSIQQMASPVEQQQQHLSLPPWAMQQHQHQHQHQHLSHQQQQQHHFQQPHHGQHQHIPHQQQQHHLQQQLQQQLRLPPGVPLPPHLLQQSQQQQYLDSQQRFNSNFQPFDDYRSQQQVQQQVPSGVSSADAHAVGGSQLHTRAESSVNTQWPDARRPSISSRKSFQSHMSFSFPSHHRRLSHRNSISSPSVSSSNDNTPVSHSSSLPVVDSSSLQSQSQPIQPQPPSHTQSQQLQPQLGPQLGVTLHNQAQAPRTVQKASISQLPPLQLQSQPTTPVLVSSPLVSHSTIHRRPTVSLARTTATSIPDSLLPSPASASGPHVKQASTPQHITSTPPVLSATDFPALPAPAQVDTRHIPTFVAPSHATRLTPTPKSRQEKRREKSISSSKPSELPAEAASNAEPAVSSAPPLPPSSAPVKIAKSSASKVAKKEESLASTPVETKSESKKKPAVALVLPAGSTQSTPSPVKAPRLPKEKNVLPVQAVAPIEPDVPAAMVSKMPKKYKPPPAKVIKIKEDTAEPEERAESLPPPDVTPSTLPAQPFLQGVPGSILKRATLSDLLRQLQDRGVHVERYSFFSPTTLTAKSQPPLKYGPLVHALSALSVGGGSFANSLPAGSIDTAVSSFQQLLETLTQTISDLLRLLPRNTWDDSSSFDGVLRDMLKGDDFLDPSAEEHETSDLPAPRHPTPLEGKEDEVAVLTQALEKRARWMEVQLSKLEELHRDINTAAVRAVLSLNDAGWDRIAPDEGRFEHVPELFLPHTMETMDRYEDLTAQAATMSIAELTVKLEEEKRREALAEASLKALMNVNAQLLWS